MSEYIYVLGMDGRPQMPTTRKRHMDKLLHTGEDWSLSAKAGNSSRILNIRTFLQKIVN